MRERRAGGIIDGDVPAPELGRDAARQRAVRRDERGGALGRFERLAQDECDGERFLAGMGCFDEMQTL